MDPRPSASTARRLTPELALLHPLWWASLGVMILNDHVLKGAGALPGVVTGKLSDVAGLVMAPALLAAITRAKTPRAVVAAHVAVGLVLAALKLWPGFAATWVAATELAGVPWRVVQDPTDLLALPALLVSRAVLVPCMSRPARQLSNLWRVTLQRTAMVVGSLACVATSAARPARPAIVAGRVLAQAWYAAPLHVIDVKTGEVLARLDLEVPMDPPIAADGMVWAVDWQDSSVVAFEVPSGRSKWRTGVKDVYFDGPKAVDARNVYVLERPKDGKTVDEAVNALVAFDRNTGRRGWSVTVGKFRAIATAGDTVVTAFGKQIAGLDAATGKTRWVLGSRADVAAIATDGERFYSGDASGLLLAIDAAKGTEAWKFDTGSKTAFASSSYYHDEARIAVAGGAVLFVRDDRLFALDAKKGTHRWMRLATARVVASGDTIVARSQEDYGRFFGLDPADGHEHWRIKVGDMVLGTPVVGDGIVLVRPHSAFLLAFDARHGHQRWTVDLDAGRAVPISRSR